MSSGSMMSNVGNSQIYEDGDQRTYKKHETDPDRYEYGQENSHKLLDSKDERSLGNVLGAAVKADKEEAQREKEDNVFQADPTRPAKDHGNKPSRGAEIDEEIKQDEEEYLRNKGKI